MITPAARAAELLARMTLDEKLGQMTIVTKNAFNDRPYRTGPLNLLRARSRPEDIATYGLGGVLSGGGAYPPDNTPSGWLDMVNGFQSQALRTRLGIPLLYGVDAVHGHGMLRGATMFPHNIGLGATRDPALLERIARAVALEVAATGIRWNYAPALPVVQDVRWGRTYESFGSDPANVAALGAAYVRGLQRPDPADPASVLATPKHFVGDGGTRWGSATTGSKRIDQGDLACDEPTLRAVHLEPYHAALGAGARTVMASYNSWNGERLHAHRRLLTDVLKGEMGFTGFVVSDWAAVDQLDPRYDEAVARAINAGIDMNMVPTDYARFIRTLRGLVRRGRVPVARVDDAVRRILEVKFAMGLFERPLGDGAGAACIGCEAHRAIAREAVARSLTRLRARPGAWPLARVPGRVLVAGRHAHDIGLQCGGWTIEWRGGTGATTPGTTILEGMREALGETRVEHEPDAMFAAGPRAPLGVAVVGEEPYAEFEGDRDDLRLADDDLARVARLREHCETLVVIVVTGRPIDLGAAAAHADVLLAAWLPGTEGAGIADVLFGAAALTGTLPVAWPGAWGGPPAD